MSKTAKEILEDTKKKLNPSQKKYAGMLLLKSTAFLEEHKDELDFLTNVAIKQYESFAVATDFNLFMCIQSIVIGVYMEAFEKGFILGSQLKEVKPDVKTAN